jgi:hypothetical protein
MTKKMAHLIQFFSHFSRKRACLQGKMRLGGLNAIGGKADVYKVSGNRLLETSPWTSSREQVTGDPK